MNTQKAVNDAQVIAVDGPSGSGKGTVSRIISEKLGWDLLDSGAMYRLLALDCLKNQIDLENETEVAKTAAKMVIEFKNCKQSQEIKVFLDGEDVTKELRLETTGNAASKVAANPSARAVLLQKQRDFAVAPGLVADGRDMGTVVFPRAKLKIFLTASAEERAKRRYKQLKQNGFDVNLAALLKEIEERDERDMNRSSAPLKPADDALIIDSSSMTIDEVVDNILKAFQKQA